MPPTSEEEYLKSSDYVYRFYLSFLCLCSFYVMLFFFFQFFLYSIASAHSARPALGLTLGALGLFWIWGSVDFLNVPWGGP